MDYKHKHFWELVGNKDYSYLIYKCTQCQKCKLVLIEFIEGSHVEAIK